MIFGFLVNITDNSEISLDKNIRMILFKHKIIVILNILDKR